MRVVLHGADSSAQVQAIERRKLFRRLAVNVSGPGAKRGPYAIEAIASVDRKAALEFRPKLREDVTLAPDSASCEVCSIELAPEEYDFLCVCDGRHTVRQAGALVWGPASSPSDVSDKKLDHILELLGTLGQFDMLVTGVQGP